MATYAQWQASGARVSRVMYLSGPSQLLQAEVIAEIRSRFPEAETLWAGSEPEALIWQVACAYPDEPATPRLVIVHEADRLRNWEPLAALLAAYRAMPHCTLLLVSGQDGYPEDTAEPGIMLRKSTGASLIRAVTPSSWEELASWAARPVPGAGRQAGADILDLTGGCLEDARDLAVKAATLVQAGIIKPTRDALAWLVSDDTASDYAKRLVAGDKAGAHAAADQLTRPQLGFAIGTLANWLDSLAIIQPAAAHGITKAKDLSRLGVSASDTRTLVPVAAKYPPSRIGSCRIALLTAAQAYREEAPVPGVASVLAASW